MTFKTLAAASLFLLGSHAFAGDYTLTIDGKQYDLDLDQAQALKVSDGHSMNVTLHRKDVITFRGTMFGFQHPGSLAPAQKKVEDGVTQTILTSPMGTLALVQEYTSIDPSKLVDTMLNALLEDEVRAGYKITRSDTSRKLADGTRLSGTKVLSVYENDGYAREVLFWKKGNSGILAVTQIKTDAPADEKQILDLFWKTLTVSRK